MSKIISFFKRRHIAEDSFESIIAPHMEVLYRQAYKYVGSEHEAEDLLQELLVGIYQKQEKLREAPVPRAWLIRCLYHLFVDRYRKQKAQPQCDDIDRELTLQSLPGLDSPERSYSYGQVLKSLNLLSPEQRMVVSLHDIEGHTLAELANTMDIPLGTLKSHLHRARKILQQELNLQPFDDAIRY